MVYAKEEDAKVLLEQYHIPYEELKHHAITSVRDTDIVLPGQQVKNLFLKNKKGKHYYLIILLDEKMADINRIAEQIGEKRLSFASSERLEEVLKVPAGTVTPFALLYDQDLKVSLILDKDIDQNVTLGFHPFINTKTWMISFKDFDKLMKSLNHPITFLDC
ncbi:hypothetical protein HMPREF9318_00574 [Streptococcus urinalis FB127-CNA-2]|uniref:YbaK/proline--tRNA ligase associated domain protein n=1 Tax=Streptococcus urinalis 2285-97 TaxID=764291 RepID=G5KGK8_9STRE|nr:YbaK/EbsC family protein [Streptococcus urinalis]EHJ57393.1 YbaK/proline--tRNA ligase associated domain protein [Streptococcus urinalis 2285-97]EKS22376.1 hypothetical protein HMPREF9318_00574 [Streptococcus urinalis FB127-CNA-2]VEF32189.1 FIG042921: similarity to aminoacyl-tRNA editing enzymes YbaK, ProX [Streptococcus urinalis]